jgi:MinD-like ATPase involved in chromosome partitioning or flagellar assembly
MKAAILNFSGNVGKSTIAAHLLKPRMPGAQVFSIESINMGVDADGLEAETMKGKKFGELVDQLMVLDDAIVDVGASNVEDFLALMQRYAGSHEDFDLFVVPVVKERKVQADTINTIGALSALGIERGRIRVVFNKVEADEVVEDEFAAIFGQAMGAKSFKADAAATVYANEVFEQLKGIGKSLGDVMADETDYRAQVRTAQNDADRELALRMVAVKRLGVTANKNLDAVFKVLMK